MIIFGVKLSKLVKKDFISKLENPTEKMTIFTPNPEILLTAKDESDYRDVLNRGNYLIPDGIGLYAGFQMLDAKVPRILKLLLIPYFGINLFIKRKALYLKYGDRICGSDLTAEIIDHANKSGKGVTIIDKFQAPGNKGDNLKIERQKMTLGLLEEKYPNAKFHQYIYEEENRDKIIEEINNTDDMYLFSSQGLRDQEITINKLMPELKNIKVAIGIGGSFDMILGFKKRAPRIFIALGLEWLWRLLINPSRMIRRVWKAIFIFLWEVSKLKTNV